MNSINARQLFVSVGFVILFVSISWLGLRMGGISAPTLFAWAGQGGPASDALAFEPTHADGSAVTKAHIVQDAIKKEDFSTANAVASETLAASHVRVWTVYPFANFVTAIADLTDPSFEAHLSAWVQKDPSNPLPALIRAQYYYDLAWFRRGHGYSKDVDTDAMKAFGRDLARSYDDVEHVLSLDHRNPYALYLRVLALRGYGMTPAMQDALQESVEAYPDFVAPSDVVLSTLQPKWGGSVEAMYAFVTAMTKGAAADSPMKVLDLDLYRYLLQVAYDGCANGDVAADALSICVQRNVKQIMTADLEARAVRALDLFGRSNDYQTSLAVESILSSILDTRGADVYSGPILLAAANGYNSDTRLQEDPAAGHNYIIDKLVARSWLMKGFNDNALTKYREALLHIGSASFPTEGEKYAAIANIHEALIRIYSAQRQYSDMIASAKAALDVGGTAFNRVDLCYAYYQLKQYDAAIAECNRALPDPGSAISARYWLGRTNLDLHNDDEALRDYAYVVGSQDSRRSTAAIDMTMIYFGRKDNQSALDILNKYSFLYNAEASDKDGVAVAYNNRCYAYMELGELKKALDDCNASLTYGTIPDAYKKQQELIKMLAPKS